MACEREHPARAIVYSPDAMTVSAAGGTSLEAQTRFGGRVAIVSGAGRGIVAAIATDSLGEDDWDSVMWSHVPPHLRSYAPRLPALAERARGRARCAAKDRQPHGPTGLAGRHDMGSNHAAAKGAIAAFTLVIAHEMFPYG